MDYSHVGVVLPVINESKNLQILLPDLLGLYKEVTIVIVDDSGTEEKKRLQSLIRSLKTDQIKLVSRNEKGGRGAAVMEGFRVLYSSDKNIEWFIEMDGDLAHKPDEISLFLKHKSSADLIIGSRYLKESVIHDWPKKRLIQSKIINFILTYWLGLSLTDYTNGFRLYSRRAVQELLTLQLKHRGFIALSEMAYKLKRKGIHIKEIPITFTDRKFGESNADMHELLASLKGVIEIRLSEL